MKYLPSSKNGPFGDADSFNLFIDKGDSSKHDILIIAGDKVDQDGMQFIRMPK